MQRNVSQREAAIPLPVKPGFGQSPNVFWTVPKRLISALEGLRGRRRLLPPGSFNPGLASVLRSLGILAIELETQRRTQAQSRNDAVGRASRLSPSLEAPASAADAIKCFFTSPIQPLMAASAILETGATIAVSLALTNNWPRLAAMSVGSRGSVRECGG
jgi:hypothetical protein